MVQDGWSSLHAACQRGGTDFIEKLLASGSSLEAKDKVFILFVMACMGLFELGSIPLIIDDETYK